MVATLFKKKEDAIASKALTIELFDRNAPTYTFTGEWSGRDIMLVGRTIARAYRTEQRSKRRLLLPELPAVSDQTETPTEELK